MAVPSRGEAGGTPARRFMESPELRDLAAPWALEPLRLRESRSGARVCDPQPGRFVERLGVGLMSLGIEDQAVELNGQRELLTVLVVGAQLDGIEFQGHRVLLDVV